MMENSGYLNGFGSIESCDVMLEFEFRSLMAWGKQLS